MRVYLTPHSNGARPVARETRSYYERYASTRARTHTVTESDTGVPHEWQEPVVYTFIIIIYNGCLIDRLDARRHTHSLTQSLPERKTGNSWGCGAHKQHRRIATPFPPQTYVLTR